MKNIDDNYKIKMSDAFKKALDGHVKVSINDNKMAGAPCVGESRIPVYMIIESLSYSPAAVAIIKKAYPDLDMHEIMDAIGFARDVIACDFDDQ